MRVLHRLMTLENTRLLETKEKRTYQLRVMSLMLQLAVQETSTMSRQAVGSVQLAMSPKQHPRAL
jgi:hypothetical protein